jgi:hypothetical protein
MKAYNLKATEVELASGVKFPAVVLGERGRGRRQVFVPCPEGLKDGDSVVLKETRTGRPKVVRGGSEDGFWLAHISTEAAYIRGARGRVYVHKDDKDKLQVIEQGWGAFGAAGRVGNWDDLLLRIDASTPVVLGVKPSRGPLYYLLFLSDEIKRFSSIEDLKIEIDVLEIDCNTLNGEDTVVLSKEHI